MANGFQHEVTLDPQGALPKVQVFFENACGGDYVAAHFDAQRANGREIHRDNNKVRQPPAFDVVQPPVTVASLKDNLLVIDGNASSFNQAPGHCPVRVEVKQGDAHAAGSPVRDLVELSGEGTGAFTTNIILR